ncbi:MAG: antiterminator LoaP [Treponema sp.]|nr:antiterminator LoaP [Treponema sp.]
MIFDRLVSNEIKRNGKAMLLGWCMKNWVILFVRTGFEEKLVHALKGKLSANEYLPFVPYKETPRRYRGIITKEREMLFPGYIFLQTEIEAHKITEVLRLSLLRTIEHKDVYSILHYGSNRADVVLREKERSCWERLFDESFCITGSVGFIEGKTIRITDGVLAGMESQIKKINRHKREAIVELEMMGVVREVHLMLEIVKKM